MLRAAVGTAWTRRCASDGRPPYQALCADVLDLLTSPGPLQQVAVALPRDSVLLIVAGPPCQDLTRAGHGQGLRGICGQRSSLAVTVPAVAHVLQRLRPDLHVHVLLESSGSMQATHRRAIAAMLGIPAAHAVPSNAQAWTAFRRNRLLFSTFPPAVTATWTPRRRAPPWLPGWAPALPAVPGGPVAPMPPMMRSRPSDDAVILASTYQYRPRHLLYRTDDVALQAAMDPARSGNLHNLGGRVRARMRDAGAPEAVLDSWDVVRRITTGTLRAPLSPAEEEAASLPAARWIAEHGPANGFRAPSIEERTRALGLDQYVALLQLPPRALFDAQGNHFDRAIVGARLGDGFATLLHNPPAPPSHQYPDGDALQRIYDDTSVAVRAAWGDADPGLAPSPLLTQATDGTSVLDLLRRLPAPLG